jgi:hypothetical protein
MKRIAACLLLGSLAAATTPHATVAASSSDSNVEILVNGTPQQRYWHRGRWYVEAIKGREYAIRLRNPFGVRVAIALSVDGLNTIDARTTTAADARKWVLEPYETVTISGWQTSQTVARRFEFTTEEGSYAQALGKGSNLGVISAVYFRERPRPIILQSPSEIADATPRAQSPHPPAASMPAPLPAPAAAPAAPAESAKNEYAATGMGRSTDHVVTQVWLDLEDAPAHSVDIRYEFRPQLVRLGIVPKTTVRDPLDRRERSKGFEPGFAPAPPRRK